jgi:HAD superfamily hydrolase (TIGR01549 family)
LDAVLFDLDGTLTDSVELVLGCYVQTIETRGRHRCTRSAVLEAFSLGSTPEVLTALLGRPVTDVDLAAFNDAVAEAIRGLAPYRGIDRALARLATRVPLAVVTGATRHIAELMLEQIRLRRYFRVVVGGDEVAEPKPSPEGILLACDRLGVAPGSTVYIGDSAIDIRAAHAAGAGAVAAAWCRRYEPGTGADLVLERVELLCLLP